MVERFESSRGLLEAADPDVVRQIDDLAEEIDWPYIRDNIGRIIERTREGSNESRASSRRCAGSPGPRPPVGVGLALGSGGRGTRDHARPAQASGRRGRRVAPRRDANPVRARPDRPGAPQSAYQRTAGDRGDGPPEGRIEVEGRREGPWVAISVSDNGPGIEPEHRRRSVRPVLHDQARGRRDRAGTGDQLTGSSPVTAAGSRSRAGREKGPASGSSCLKLPSTGPPPLSGFPDPPSPTA